MELDSYLHTAAFQIFDVDNAEVCPNLDPLNKVQPALGTNQDPYRRTANRQRRAGRLQ